MRLFLLSLVISSLAACAQSVDGSLSDPEEYEFDSDGRRVTVLRYAASGEGIRPVVLLLHGGSGFLRFRNLYEKHATNLASNGSHVYVVMYYSNNDHRTMTSSDRDARQTLYRERLVSWVRTTVDALDFVIARPESDASRIAILGFSQGAYVAAGAAGSDERVSALVVKYGGLPSALAEHINRMPPTLIIHGEADRVVPIEEAHDLAAFLDEIGATYALLTYPDAGHGFDNQDSAQANDSIQRTVDFLVTTLQ